MNSLRALNMSPCIQNPHSYLVPFHWPWFWSRLWLQRRKGNDQGLYRSYLLTLLPVSPPYNWWKFKIRPTLEPEPQPEPPGVCRALTGKWGASRACKILLEDHGGGSHKGWGEGGIDFLESKKYIASLAPRDEPPQCSLSLYTPSLEEFSACWPEAGV